MAKDSQANARDTHVFNDATRLPPETVNDPSDARCIVLEPRHGGLKSPTARSDLGGRPNRTKEIEGWAWAIICPWVVVLINIVST